MGFFDVDSNRLGIIAPPQGDSPVPTSPGKIVTETVDHWLGGPCPEGQIIGAIDLDNPLNNNEVTRHNIIRCLDVLPQGGGGGGAATGGFLNNPFGGTIGPGGGRGSSYEYQIDPNTIGSDPYAHFPPEVQKKMKDLHPATEGPCIELIVDSGVELGERSDPFYPGREYALCSEREVTYLRAQMAILLNSTLLARFPGFRQCIEGLFNELSWCCHSTYTNEPGPWSSEYNVNLSYPDDFYTNWDPRFQETVDVARGDGVVRLGAWFFKLENHFLAQVFLVRLLGELCPLGLPNSSMYWEDTVLLLNPYPWQVICRHLSDRKRSMGSKKWEELQRNCREGADPDDFRSQTFMTKFFAFNLCTGDVYIQPLPSPGSGLPPTKALDENGNPISLNGDLSCVE